MTGSSYSPYSRRSVRSDAAPSPSPPLACPNPHPNTQAELTLMQLFVWSHDPLQRLTTLAQLVRGTSKLKGGAMTVAIERLRRHGDPAVAGHVSHLLKRACEPLFGMLRRWLLHGELDDPHAEFFIESCAPPTRTDPRGDHRVHTAYTVHTRSTPLCPTCRQVRGAARAHVAGALSTSRGDAPIVRADAARARDPEGAPLLFLCSASLSL